MTDEEMGDAAKQQAALLMAAMSPHMTQIVVTQAVVAAMITTHPEPALLRQRAESLLMQAQAMLAITDTGPQSGGKPPLLLPDSMQKALDFLFRPVLHLDPD